MCRHAVALVRFEGTTTYLAIACPNTHTHCTPHTNTQMHTLYTTYTLALVI